MKKIVEIKYSGKPKAHDGTRVDIHAMDELHGIKIAPGWRELIESGQVKGFEGTMEEWLEEFRKSFKKTKKKCTSR